MDDDVGLDTRRRRSMEGRHIWQYLTDMFGNIGGQTYEATRQHEEGSNCDVASK